MVPLHQISGRLGNQMFQLAFIYAYAKENGTDIYLQDPKYFEKYANEIKAIFGDVTWTGEPLSEYVSIHVRRGDYVGNSFYVDLTKTDYYRKAMAEFPERKFMIFSDDIDWCKENIKITRVGGLLNGNRPVRLEEDQRKIHFSEGRSEIEDLNLMMRCDGHIIANSTYSWWGAWLGKGKVVAPSVSNWYSDGFERTVCPKEWIRI